MPRCRCSRAAVSTTSCRTRWSAGSRCWPAPRSAAVCWPVRYAALEPGLAFVVEDGGRAVGYILGTADTASFVDRYRAEWLPGLAGRHPAPVREPATPAEAMTALMHTPERMILPELAGYPAHLHIDLLPTHQRAGHGRRLMATFLAALHEQGVKAVHLSMLTANTRARAFYDRVGFHEIAVPDPGPVTYLGRATR
ncbi:GNAT family N-acetyltransferase [Streptomyces fimicarius]|uniref:GNAT family N-acetyltransferase n=1 Tax=Streptomyces griseus TaxID=1911 RepID=UPI0036EEFEF3